MRRDDLYLNDIVEAADHIAAFLGQTDLEGFRQSELVRSAVVQKLAIIGEAAARISDDVDGPIPGSPVAADSRLPEHFDPCIFRDRLERSLEGGYG